MRRCIPGDPIPGPVKPWVYYAVLFIIALLLLTCCVTYCCCVCPPPPMISKKKKKKKKKDEDGPHKIFEPSDKKKVIRREEEEEGVLIRRPQPYNVKINITLPVNDPKPLSSVYGESFDERMYMSGKKRSMLTSSSSSSHLSQLRGRESPILSSSSTSAVSIVVPRTHDGDFRSSSSDQRDLPPMSPPYLTNPAAGNRSHVRSLSGTRMLPTFQVSHLLFLRLRLY